MCIHLSTDGATLVAIDTASGTPSTKPHLRCAQITNLDDSLRKVVDDWELHDYQVNVVLAHESYLFSLVEAPVVPEQERLDALRWQLTSLGQYSAEELVLDYIKLPDNAYRGRKDMVYVAAFPKRKMDRIALQLKQSGLALESIEIAELALTHLIKYIDATSANNFAWMHCDTQQHLLNIYGDGALYFTRRLNATDKTPSLNDLVEVKRSLDYCRHQVSGTACQTIWLSPLMMGEIPFARQLDKELGLTVNWLDLADWFEADHSLTPEFQQQYLLAVAGALRSAP